MGLNRRAILGGGTAGGRHVGGRIFASQMAKVLGAEISDSAKELILGGNLRRIYAPILRAKGYVP